MEQCLIFWQECPSVLLIPQNPHLPRLRLTTSILQSLPPYLEITYLEQIFKVIQLKTVMVAPPKTDSFNNSGRIDRITSCLRKGSNNRYNDPPSLESCHCKQSSSESEKWFHSWMQWLENLRLINENKGSLIIIFWRERGRQKEEKLYIKRQRRKEKKGDVRININLFLFRPLSLYCCFTVFFSS